MKLISTISFGKNNKSCGTCTKCCEGWLKANIEGKQMFPGQPCYFLQKNVGCKRYETRPNFPCKSFKCTWLEMKDIPDEWKPEKTGVIMKESVLHGFEYISFIQAPKTPSKEMVLWAKEYFKKKKMNFLYVDKLGVHPFGDKFFIREVRDHKHLFVYEDYEKYNI